MNVEYSKDKGQIGLKDFVSYNVHRSLNGEEYCRITAHGLAGHANSNSKSTSNSLGILCDILAEKGILNADDILRIARVDGDLQLVSDDSSESKHDS